MTMTVELGALEQVVVDLARNGRYGSKSEVLRAGVRLVQEREAALAALLGKIDDGLADIETGRVAPLEAVGERLKARFGVADE